MIPVLLFPLLLASAPGAAGPQDVSRSEAVLAAAREELSAAHDAVESLVQELQDDYRALTRGPDAATHKNTLVIAMLDGLPAARARMETQQRQGRRLVRASRKRILMEVFGPTVRDATPVDERLSLWVADRVAEVLAARGDLTAVDAEVILRTLEGLFEPNESWFAFWNRSFRVGLPEVERYKAAQQTYEDAGLALERLRHPERYGPRGQPAPPGMVIVPGGSYTLGPNHGWPRPARKVTLKPFALDQREVTNREYAQFVNALPADERREALPRGWVLDAGGLAVVEQALRGHPVTFVSWRQAARYASSVGKRLPTEDEWEAAAGGLAARAYPWGNGFLVGKANGAGAATGTLPVESYPDAASASGCFDMAGNVWEWVATLEDGTDIDELPDGIVNVVIRGGGWSSPREELATRYRWTALGRATFADAGYHRPIGFRCAQDL